METYQQIEMSIDRYLRYKMTDSGIFMHIQAHTYITNNIVSDPWPGYTSRAAHTCAVNWSVAVLRHYEQSHNKPKSIKINENHFDQRLKRS